MSEKKTRDKIISEVKQALGTELSYDFAMRGQAIMIRVYSTGRDLLTITLHESETDGWVVGSVGVPRDTNETLFNL